jgi:hypothetical protein
VDPGLHPRGPDRLAEGPSDYIEDLLDVAVRIALLGGRSHASLDVVLEDQQSYRIHCRSEGRSLLEDVDAVLAPLDHSLDAANLAFDATEPPDEGCLVPRVGVAKCRIEIGSVSGRLDDAFAGRSGQEVRGGAKTGTTDSSRPLWRRGGGCRGGAGSLRRAESVRFSCFFLHCHSTSLGAVRPATGRSDRLPSARGGSAFD